MSDDVCVGVECRMTGDIGEGQLPLCLCHHIITSWDSPTTVDNRSSVTTEKNGTNNYPITINLSMSLITLLS